MSNQQERLGIEEWIVGFTDGEGCFSVSIFRNVTTKLGWQVFPEFVVTQGEKSLSALEIFLRYFGCGKIFVNTRYDNHNEHLYRYCVRSLKELNEAIVPFFQKHQLRTAKGKDFRLFVGIIEMMKGKKHLTPQGIRSIARKIELMNRQVPSQFLKSSVTRRYAPPVGGWRYGPKHERKLEA